MGVRNLRILRDVYIHFCRFTGNMKPFNANMIIKIQVLGFFSSSSTPADATSELHVLGHDRHTLRVERDEVGVLEQTGQVGFGGFLKSEHGESLHAHRTGSRVLPLDDLLHQPLERRLAQQQFCRLLILADLADRRGSGAVATFLKLDTRIVRPFHAGEDLFGVLFPFLDGPVLGAHHVA